MCIVYVKRAYNNTSAVVELDITLTITYMIASSNRPTIHYRDDISED